MKFSLGILKPDCFERGLSNDVFREIKNSGLVIVDQQDAFFYPETISVVYRSSLGKEYYEGMSEFLMSGQVTAYIVYADHGDAIDRLNKLVGTTDPWEAGSKTIRGKFGQSIRRNISHSTFDETCYNEEIRKFFSEDWLRKLGVL